MLFECPHGCQEDIGMSRARELHRCERHGAVLHYTRALKSEKPRAARKPRKPMKRTEKKRDWSDARAKVDEEQVCRVCGSNENVEAAHIIGREHDEPLLGSQTLYVHPNRIVPLCGPFSRMKCHVAFDANALDVLGFLTTVEQAQAVQDAGSIESARRRTAPSLYKILPERASGEVAA